VRLIAGFCILDIVLGIATFVTAFAVMNDFRHEAAAQPPADPRLLAAFDAAPSIMLAVGAIVLVAAALGVGTALRMLWKRRSPVESNVGNDRVVKTLTHPDGQRRVLIVQRTNGLYGYEIEEFRLENVEFRHEPLEYWVSLSQVPFAIFDTAETAEREARHDIAWLKEVPPA
jgi:hypothetical protein